MMKAHKPNIKMQKTGRRKMPMPEPMPASDLGVRRTSDQTWVIANHDRDLRTVIIRCVSL